jgi:hypothetical protein
VLSYSAYVAEVFRAGIESVHPQPADGGAVPRAGRARRCATSSCRRPCGRCTHRC